MPASERSAGLEGVQDRKNETSWHFSHFAIWLTDKLDAGVWLWVCNRTKWNGTEDVWELASSGDRFFRCVVRVGAPGASFGSVQGWLRGIPVLISVIRMLFVCVVISNVCERKGQKALVCV